MPRYNKRFPIHARALVIPAIAGACFSGAVAAQLEEVMVTAQKRQQSMQDVPIALSAFSENTMKDMGIVNAQDLQVATPGLVYTSVGTLGSPYLRGVGTRFSLNGLDNSVATYVGDRYVARGAGNQLEFGIDVERVEVLKGPQGILYGRNATGGAIRVIKKPVADELEGSLRASAGNYDLREFSGTVSVPLTDTLGVRLSGQLSKRDAWQDNLAYGVDPNAVDKINDKDVAKFSSIVRWEASDQTTVNLLVDYWEQDDYQGHDGSLLGPPELNVGVARAGAVYSTGRKKAGTDTYQPTDGDETSSELRIEHAFDDFDISSISTYARFDMRWTSEGDGSSAHITTPAIAYDESETWSQEIRLTSNTSDSLEWTTGLFYYKDTHTTEFNFFADPMFPPLINATSGNQTTETTAAAIFGHLGWAFNETWALKVGARYSYEEREALLVESVRPGITTLGGSGMPFNVDENWNEITPLVTLEYHMPNALAYLTYTRGFKSGGYNFPASSTPDALEPEILDMYELGLKGDYLDSTLRINGALFYYDYSDLQVTRASDGGVTTTENAADATVLGLDMDITYVLGNFSLHAGLNILDSEYQNYAPEVRVFRANVDGTMGTDNPTPGGGRLAVPHDADGDSMLRAPDYSYFVTASYEFAVGDARAPVSVSYSYKDDFNYDFPIDPTASRWLTQEGYGLVNARAGYISADDKWAVYLWGRNLSDKEYLNEVSLNSSGLRGFWAMPRTSG
ncbi:MAG: TonB-dependent receptor, partial [Parahaliea sp.]